MARSDLALVSAKKMRERVKLPKGVVIAYRMRIAYFDVISRQAPPNASHFSLTSMAPRPISRRACLKATTSAVEPASVSGR